MAAAARQPSDVSGRSDTTTQDTFNIVRPNNSVVEFSFNTDAARPGLTLFRLPEGSTWAPMPHWHESYTEYLLVVRGRVKVMLDGVVKVVTAADGPQVVDKYVVHEWMRADKDEVEKDEGEVVVEEWTDPADGIKQVFFRNLLGVFHDANNQIGTKEVLQIFLICSQYDNYDALLPLSTPKWLSWATTHSVLGAVRIVAGVLQLKPWYESYTPQNLRRAAAATRLPVEKED